MRLVVAGSRWIPVGVALLIVDAAIRVHGLRPTEVLIAVDGKGPVGPAEAGAIWARARGIVVRTFYARWLEFGDAAGDERRARMIDSATAVLALWDGLSTGTQDLVARARKRGLRAIQLEVVPSKATAERLAAERRKERKPRVPAFTRVLERAA